eukprot:TRINITY_DN3941_c0_g1_i1.p2 TRINITY_DN3941_c0_g1~~TRINITY_DN3941_c0_g1_i1.p2  ORF type:complete len:331 (+),score=44.40 TRINITY_DN3941_c0_g1_i1:78-1070(+)
MLRQVYNKETKGYKLDMEAEDEWMHYCEEPKSGQFVLCSLKDLKEIQTRKYRVPYDSLYLFDTVQTKNIIYFSGGGAPASESSAEQFYQIMMKVTIKPTMDTVADKLANMNTARANHAMAAVGSKFLYAVGGVNSSGNIASCEEYNIETNKWREIAQLNEKKKWVTLCSYKGRYLYAFGGSTNNEAKATDIIEFLDTSNPTAKTWEVIKLTSGKDLWTNCFFVGAVPVSDKCIMLFGGIVKDAEKDNCVGFNPETKAMEKRGNLLRPDAFYRTKYGMKGEKFAIVGSHDGDLHIYDKAQGKWDLMLKTIWNPEYGVELKADTFQSSIEKV